MVALLRCDAPQDADANRGVPATPDSKALICDPVINYPYRYSCRAPPAAIPRKTQSTPAPWRASAAVTIARSPARTGVGKRLCA